VASRAYTGFLRWRGRAASCNPHPAGSWGWGEWDRRARAGRFLAVCLGRVRATRATLEAAARFAVAHGGGHVSDRETLAAWQYAADGSRVVLSLGVERQPAPDSGPQA
jgi:hypothetical protein